MSGISKFDINVLNQELLDVFSIFPKRIKYLKENFGNSSESPDDEGGFFYE